MQTNIKNALSRQLIIHSYSGRPFFRRQYYQALWLFLNSQKVEAGGVLGGAASLSPPAMGSGLRFLPLISLASRHYACAYILLCFKVL